MLTLVTLSRDRVIELSSRLGECRPHDILAGRSALLVLERPIRRAVDRRAGLLAPAFGERTHVDGAVADRVEERGHGRLRRGVVARDWQVRTVRRASRPRQAQQVLEEDVVEDLHDLRARKIAGQELAVGHRLAVQLSYLP